VQPVVNQAKAVGGAQVPKASEPENKREGVVHKVAEVARKPVGHLLIVTITKRRGQKEEERRRMRRRRREGGRGGQGLVLFNIV
jgi:hypothetical protein